MPNRYDAGDYTYAYQGQEKDVETGMEAFELRLWDARIGRWLSPDPAGQYHSPYLGMGNNPISQIDPDGGFDTKFGAFLYRFLHGTGGKLFENEHGTWGIDVAGDDGGFDLITGTKWERNLRGTFSLQYANDDTFVQFGADPSISTFMKSNLSFSVSRNSTNRPVKISDYTFNAIVASKSSTPGVNRNTGVISAAIKIESGGKNNIRELKPLISEKPMFYDSHAFISVETSFKLKNQFDGNLKVTLHRLQWFHKGTEQGAHIGTKFGVPAGIDPLLGFISTTFFGKKTLVDY